MGDDLNEANPGCAGAVGRDWVPYAWIEELDDDHVFIATERHLAAFRRRELPGNWGARFRAPSGNLVLAHEIDSAGSPEGTPLGEVTRLDWPMDDS